MKPGTRSPREARPLQHRSAADPHDTRRSGLRLPTRGVWARGRRDQVDEDPPLPAPPPPFGNVGGFRWLNEDVVYRCQVFPPICLCAFKCTPAQPAKYSAQGVPRQHYVQVNNPMPTVVTHIARV